MNSLGSAGNGFELVMLPPLDDLYRDITKLAEPVASVRLAVLVNSEFDKACLLWAPLSRGSGCTSSSEQQIKRPEDIGPNQHPGCRSECPFLPTRQTPTSTNAQAIIRARFLIGGTRSTLRLCFRSSTLREHRDST